jgi:hypothetical protein
VLIGTQVRFLEFRKMEPAGQLQSVNRSQFGLEFFGLGRAHVDLQLAGQTPAFKRKEDKFFIVHTTLQK